MGFKTEKGLLQTKIDKLIYRYFNDQIIGADAGSANFGSADAGSANSGSYVRHHVLCSHVRGMTLRQRVEMVL